MFSCKRGTKLLLTGTSLEFSQGIVQVMCGNHKSQASLPLPVKPSRTTSFISPVAFFSEKASRDLSERTGLCSYISQVSLLFNVNFWTNFKYEQANENFGFFFCLFVWFVGYICLGFLVLFLSFLDCYFQGT